jgi:hypothetical protein
MNPLEEVMAKRRPERKLLGVLTVDEAVRQAKRQHEMNRQERAERKRRKGAA